MIEIKFIWALDVFLKLLGWALVAGFIGALFAAGVFWLVQWLVKDYR